MGTTTVEWNEEEQARDDIVRTKGFFILPSELFGYVLKKAAGDENLNETLETVFQNIEGSAQGTDSEDDFKGLFDDIILQLITIFVLKYCKNTPIFAP